MAEALGAVMLGWWVCCACGNQNNPALTSQYCSSCFHGRCLGCMLIKPMRSPSPEADADVPAENTTPNLESEPRNEPRVDIQAGPTERPEGEDLNDAYSESDLSESRFSDQSQSSRTSAISTDMTAAGTAELVRLLLNDYLIASCANEALRRTSLSVKNFQNKLRRLLKQWAKDLKLESEPEPYEKYIAPLFIRRLSRYISYQLCASITGEDGGHLYLNTVPDKSDHRAKVENYLRKGRKNYQQSKRRPRDPTGGSDDDSQSDTDSEDDGFEMDFEFPNLERLQQYLIEGQPYQSLRENIFHLVYPSLHQRLKNLMTRLSRSHLLSLRDAHQYQTIISETQYASPNTMYLSGQERESWINAYQELIEKWTSMKWDWWPLRPCRRTLAPSERRLFWRCCGQQQWIELTTTVATNVQQCLDKYWAEDQSAWGLRQLLAQDRTRNPGQHRPGQYSNFPTQTSSTNLQSNVPQPGSIRPPGPAAPSQPSRVSVQVPHQVKANAQGTLKRERYVIILVKRGDRYLMSQVDVGQLCDHTFFQSLRTEYRRLRGWLRNLLSVWRYSHCDFYQFEKFDDAAYAPKLKNNYPPSKDHYEYNPTPMDIIPPITEHEFYSRFYACYTPSHSPVHMFHTCRQHTSNDNDALCLLPKKKSKLEEHGSKRERFWGIYAQEIVCFRWVVAYNIFCMLPMVVFFLLWVLPVGYRGDLQNASVPATVMVGMLTLFWTVFLGTLRYPGSR